MRIFFKSDYTRQSEQLYLSCSRLNLMPSDESFADWKNLLSFNAWRIGTRTTRHKTPSLFTLWSIIPDREPQKKRKTVFYFNYYYYYHYLCPHEMLFYKLSHFHLTQSCSKSIHIDRNYSTKPPPLLPTFQRVSFCCMQQVAGVTG